MRVAAKISTSAAQATPMPQDASKSCGFLDILPAELRNRIYELVLGNSTIHIYTDLVGWDSNFEVFTVPPAPNDERILRDFCSAEDEEESHIEKIKNQDPAEAHHDEHDRRHILCRGRGSATDAFALLQTCRQIHSEAALIPFLSNTFSFFDLITLDQFLRRLIPKQARAIQHMSFTINSDSSFPHPPITTAWKRLLGGELESLVCIAEFVGDREEGFEESGKDCEGACMAFRGLMVRDLRVMAYNVYEDEDDELVTAKELKEWAKEVEEKLKVSAKDEPQKRAGEGQGNRKWMGVEQAED